MKIRLAISCLTICFVSMADLAAQQSEPSFPYKAFVKQEGAQVHSGPASVHYATDKLEQGAIVEVYSHDPGGWCSIRPPAGSFSLIPEAALIREEGKLARVSEDKIKAWVGTRLGAVEKPLWQVKLRKDEIVEILGEVSWPHPDGYSTIWYQVAPPAGEFRWIQLANIQPPKPDSDLPQPGNNTASNIDSSFAVASTDSQATGYQSSDPVFEDDATSAVNLDPPSERDATTNRGWRPASRPIRIADQRNDVTVRNVEPFKIPAIDGPSKVDPESSPPLDLVTSNSSFNSIDKLDSENISDSDNASATMAPISGPVSKRIVLLETSLTTEMLKSPAEWQLESILRQATSIASGTNNVTERQHAERLVAKVRKCVAIQSQFDVAYNGKPTGADATGLNQPSSGRLGVGNGLDNNVQFGATYDAHGWLNQLVRSKGSQQPTYVLEDDNGRILYHIAPSPGLNLNRYLKNKVGVVGRRGFHRDLQLDHVTAERIVVIDSLRR